MNPPSEGFAAVAEWMARDPDSETFIFRKFDKLAARNLLFLQARIMSLEKQLEALDKEISNTTDMILKDAARTWEVRVEQDSQGQEHAQRYMKLVVQIKQALKEYYEALVLQSQISNLHKPSKRTLDVLKHWFNIPFPVLGGQSKHFLDAQDGLVALTAQRDFDPISQLLRRIWPAKARQDPSTREVRADPAILSQKEPARDGALHIGRYNEAAVSWAAKGVTVLAATYLLVGPIFALYTAKDPWYRLVLIQLFKGIFALSAGFMPNARRAELFAATAAYAAVLVVFVGSAESPGKESAVSGPPQGS